jgi:hypothetical protein
MPFFSPFSTYYFSPLRHVDFSLRHYFIFRLSLPFLHTISPLLIFSSSFHAGHDFTLSRHYALLTYFAISLTAPPTPPFAAARQRRRHYAFFVCFDYFIDCCYFRYFVFHFLSDYFLRQITPLPDAASEVFRVLPQPLRHAAASSLSASPPPSPLRRHFSFTPLAADFFISFIIFAIFATPLPLSPFHFSPPYCRLLLTPFCYAAGFLRGDSRLRHFSSFSISYFAILLFFITDITLVAAHYYAVISAITPLFRHFL